MPLYVAFIDFTKAFDTVCCDGLVQWFQKFVLPNKLINIIKVMHSGMQECASQGEIEPRELSVPNGVKQRYALMPTLFLLYMCLAAMLGVA